MNKIAIVGCSGAGKSTLARQLGELLNIPVFHLDAELWNAGWVMSSDAEEFAKLHQLISHKSWIIDGNYGSTMNIRFREADTIIFLDFSRWICLTRVLKRWWRYRNATRPDMAKDCPERLDIAFLRWIWNFRKSSRPKVIATLDQYQHNSTIITLHHPRDVHSLLQQIVTHTP